MWQRLMDWWHGVRVVETKCFTWGDADRIFKQQNSIHRPWRLSPMEDYNLVIGAVWLERIAPVPAAAPNAADAE